MESNKLEQYLDYSIGKRNYDQLARIQLFIPKKSIEDYKIANKGKIRERVFSLETTLLGMIIQAGQEDKSKQNAVTILSKLHDDRKEKIKKDREKIIDATTEELGKNKAEGVIKMGRPQKRFLSVQKSKEKGISLYPSSYDEATIRYPTDLIKDIFHETTQWNKIDDKNTIKWKDKNVYIVDGTTFRTQDTKPLREYFDCDRKKNNQPLPVGKMEGFINLYGGGLVAVVIDKYTSSEGRMFKKLFNQIPSGTIVLADDLYSKYGYFSYCKKHSIDLITQKKSNDKEEIIREITGHDKIVKWERGKTRKSVLYDNIEEMEESILLRKIELIDPAEPTRSIILYTSLLDEHTYPAVDIIGLFFKRWEIEISFRQIKSILKMEYLRGKTVEMVKKEIYAHLILYNIIRKMLSEDQTSASGYFPPSGSEVQVGVTMAKSAYVDKLGRSYHRWNAGRHKKGVTTESS